MKPFGTNSKKYAEAMQWRDWQTCELICAEHEELLQTILALESKLAEAVKVIEFYGEMNNWRDSAKGFDSGEMDQIENDSEIHLGILWGGKRAREFLNKMSER